MSVIRMFSAGLSLPKISYYINTAEEVKENLIYNHTPPVFPVFRIGKMYASDIRKI